MGPNKTQTLVHEESHSHGRKGYIPASLVCTLDDVIIFGRPQNRHLRRTFDQGLHTFGRRHSLGTQQGGGGGGKRHELGCPKVMQFPPFAKRKLLGGENKDGLSKYVCVQEGTNLSPNYSHA